MRSTGTKSNFSTMVTRMIIISFTAKKRPGHKNEPPAKALYADVGFLLSKISFRQNLFASNLDEQGPHTSLILWISAEGTKTVEPCFKRCWMSSRVSSSTLRADILTE